VLATRDRSNVVIRRTGIKVTSFAAEWYESPHPNVDARAKIENAASKFPRRLIRLAINLLNALFVVGMSAAYCRIRRDPR